MKQQMGSIFWSMWQTLVNPIVKLHLLTVCTTHFRWKVRWFMIGFATYLDDFRFDIHGWLILAKCHLQNQRWEPGKRHPSQKELAWLHCTGHTAMRLWGYASQTGRGDANSSSRTSLALPYSCKTESPTSVDSLLFINWQGHIYYRHWPSDFRKKTTQEFHLQRFSVGSAGSSFGAGSEPQRPLLAEEGFHLPWFQRRVRSQHKLGQGTKWGGGMKLTWAKAGQIQSFKVQPVQESKITRLQ